MSSPKPLLAAVGADPADDRPRLAFAAWAEEHGEPERAEFIRLQVGLPAAVDGGDPAWPEAHERAVRLLAANEAAWAGPLAPFAGEGRVSFERGFVASVGVTDETWCADWLERLGRALQEHPVTKLWLSGRAARERGRLFAALPGWPRASAWRELSFIGGGPMGEGELAALGASPHAQGLRRLGLGEVGAGALRAFAETPLASRLGRLEVTIAPGAGRAWCEALAALLARSGVEALSVQARDECRVPEVLAALAGARLSELELGFWSALDDAGLEALAQWPGTRGLRALELNDHHATPAGFAGFFGRADLPALTRLAADPCEDDGMRGAEPAWAALLAAPFADRLERLSLADWQIGAAALEPLAAGRLPRLRQLDLADVACGDGGAIALAGAACAPHLRELVLPGCGITGVGAEALRGADFRRLEWLLLNGNPIGAEAEARLRARFGGRLTYARAWP